MCGIAGVVVKREAHSPAAVERGLEAMVAQVVHRGPDDRGIVVVGPAGLGHQRLAVIDLRERARQPMSLADGDLWIVFNGEIYNFRELRTRLQGSGCQFRTDSDTEVLLHGWRIWGERLVDELRGMFAFAIWDQRDRSLFLARDRFGKKPLFYSDQADGFFFASEIKSLLAWPNFPRHVNLDAIHDYLTFGYCIGEYSAFAGVKNLPPGHTMLLRDGITRPPRRYWRLAEVSASADRRSPADLATELIERLDDAIQCRLVADVPLGAFLSGGVDSSAVVARMSQMLDAPVKTFSVGFDIPGYDETPFAAMVAERYATDHRSFTMGYDLIQELPKLIWHYGEPYADSSSLVTYALAREIRKHVTVALTGDGGDEIFLGYSRYARFVDQVAAIRAERPRPLPYQCLLDSSQATRVRDHYVRRVASFRDEHKHAGYGPVLAEFLLSPSSDRLGISLESATFDTAIECAARLEVETYLPGDLLVKADIATMAASLEGRSPFLDHELADWAAALPQHLRVFERNGALELKGLLKRALEPILPAEILYRPKRGFSVPVRHWMRHEIKDFMVGLLTSSTFKNRGLVTPRYVDQLMTRHFSGREDHGTRLWTLLCLELWFRTFIDRSDDGPLAIDVTVPLAS